MIAEASASLVRTGCDCELRVYTLGFPHGPEHKCRLMLQECIDAGHRHWRPCPRCERSLVTQLFTCDHGTVTLTYCPDDLYEISSRRRRNG